MLRWIVTSLLIGVPAASTIAQPSSPLNEAVASRVESILDEAQRTGDFTAARQQSEGLFDRVLAWAGTGELDAFRRAAFARRLTDQLARAELQDGPDVLRYLRANPGLAEVLVFLVKPEDDPAEVFALLERLRAAHGDKLDEYATLAAAICVVHERPLVRKINENVVDAADPLDIFRFYVQNERQMLFGVRSVPAELLVYVVDSTSPVSEMRWALSEYAGNKRIGAEFHRIEYDHAHFRNGAPKKVTVNGYTLANIKRYGGVCADQAYFAMAAGKSIGVPTAYTVGRGGNVGHAWVGYFQTKGKQGAWNFNEGRYAVYQGVRGETFDSQTRERVDDSYVSLLGELIGSSTVDRHAAVAMTDAAERLLEMMRGGASLRPPQLPDAGDDEPRPVTAAEALGLIEAGLRRCTGYARGWEVIADMAEQGELTFAQKKRWADLVMKLCGQNYPDFAVAILHPMIRTIEDVKEQNAVWDAAFKKFSRRKDLAAEIRLAQGEGWERAGHPANAGRCYHDVIVRYPNASPLVIIALRRTEQMLIASGKSDRVLELYRGTWETITPPERMAPDFMVQSNWYRVAHRYAERLRQAGNDRAADKVEDKVEQVTGVAAGG